MFVDALHKVGAIVKYDYRKRNELNEGRFIAITGNRSRPTFKIVMVIRCRSIVRHIFVFLEEMEIDHLIE